jgi:3-methyladenine DNA glycosylase AlkD
VPSALDIDALVMEIDRELRKVGTPERAAGSKAYLKSDLTFYGTTMPDKRKIVRAVLKAHPELDGAGLLSLVRSLWAAPIHERRMAAILLLEARVRLLEVKDVELVESLLRDSKTWAYVDPLAVNVMGALFDAEPAVTKILDRWARDDDFWIRRSALLALLKPVKQGREFDRFTHYADEMLEEKEFFIRKAIGWVLRERSKKDPETVSEWVKPRLERMSGVTRREAVKYLDLS